MKFIKFSLIALILALSVPAFASGRLEFILDVSGSMGALAGGEKKMDAAKKAIAATVQGIPDGTVVALRLYGHRVPNNQKAESCVDSQLVIPFGPINKPQFIAALNQAMPLGQTPIAYSLQEAAKDFGVPGDEETAIILVSDGAETCGGDPVAVAKDLMAKGFKIKIHTIGFDVDANTRAQLEAISTATGGQYRDARDTAGLSQSLQTLTQESLVIKKEKSVYGGEIRGGDSYETAVPLPPGSLHRLDHHQKKNDFDYFYVDLTGGQRLVATVQTGEKGVRIQNGTATENANPYAGIQLHNSDRQRIVYDTIIGTRNGKKEIWVNLGDGQEGRYYIVVGNTYDDQNKDNPFKIEVIDQFDAGSKQDAGETEAKAVPIQPGEMSGYLGPGDQVDMYKFSTVPGGLYNLKARPVTGDLRIRAVLFDSDGVKLLTQDAPNAGAALKIENFPSANGGDIFVKLQSFYSTVPLSEYNMSFAQSGGTTAAPAASPAAAPAAPVPPASGESGATAQAPAEKPGTLAQNKANSHALSSVSSEEELALLLEGIPFLEKAKWYLLYSGIPLVAGWLIGMIWGYIKGRKAGKRKAQAQN